MIGLVKRIALLLALLRSTTYADAGLWDVIAFMDHHIVVDNS